MQQSAHNRDTVLSISRVVLNPFENLMNGIGIGEDVVSRLPIRMLVGGAEASDPERRRVSKRSPDIGGGGAATCRRRDRFNNCYRIVTEEAVSQRRVIRPKPQMPAGGEEARQ